MGRPGSAPASGYATLCGEGGSVAVTLHAHATRDAPAMQPFGVALRAPHGGGVLPPPEACWVPDDPAGGLFEGFMLEIGGRTVTPDWTAPCAVSHDGAALVLHYEDD